MFEYYLSIFRFSSSSTLEMSKTIFLLLLICLEQTCAVWFTKGKNNDVPTIGKRKIVSVYQIPGEKTIGQEASNASGGDLARKWVTLALFDMWDTNGEHTFNHLQSPCTCTLDKIVTVKQDAFMWNYIL